MYVKLEIALVNQGIRLGKKRGRTKDRYISFIIHWKYKYIACLNGHLLLSNIQLTDRGNRLLNIISDISHIDSDMSSLCSVSLYNRILSFSLALIKYSLVIFRIEIFLCSLDYGGHRTSKYISPTIHT